MLFAERENNMNNRLREIRKKRGIKVDTLTELLDISAVHYYDLEKGSRRLNEDILHKLADFYNVTTDYILGREATEEVSKTNEDKTNIDFETKEIINDLSTSILSPEAKDIIRNLIKMHKKKQ